ncbi:MAG TPA: PQQ-dependent dehydrogenase, methanol/ethanol family [Gammaproteobacteria bacterium]|nr:PQQ-dependent dehydrogenase, methanol/ethanol family [Gammaproteobacteria bacterium]
MIRPRCAAAVLLLAAAGGAQAQVTFERLLNAADEPHNWLTYSGTYQSQRHSLLRQIRPSNVEDLELKWVFQAQSLENFETTPLVVDGIMYLTEAPNTAVALDAESGRLFWRYQYNPSAEARPCCGRVNRGLAILGDKVFMAAIDSELIAIDAKTGQPVWQRSIADPSLGYAMTLAPLVVKDQVIVGVAGGEYGIRGFIAAYDADTGDELWRFYTIPAPGEPGFETWQDGGDAWQHGGASVWLTGSYDPELNVTYWGIGNPGPDWNPAQRPGDNLYSDSVVALDADTGELKWHFQFTPNDDYDYDAVQIPVLVDLQTADVTSGKLMLWGNRNGFFYVLDRVTGTFVRGNPFVKVNWARGLDESGRPIETPQPPGAVTFPGVQGGTNWYSPSYSPNTELFYLSAWENYGSTFGAQEADYQPGRVFLGGWPGSPIPGAANLPGIRRGPINNWTEAVGNGAVIAIDPKTGEQRWRFPTTDVSSSGILTTASDLLFTGSREGFFYALDAQTGGLLWRTSLGGQGANGPISYAVDGTQYVAVASGNGLFVFGLRN